MRYGEDVTGRGASDANNAEGMQNTRIRAEAEIADDRGRGQSVFFPGSSRSSPKREQSVQPDNSGGHVHCHDARHSPHMPRARDSATITSLTLQQHRTRLGPWFFRAQDVCV